MTVITISDADILALGGDLPRRGTIQVRRLTPQGIELDSFLESVVSLSPSAKEINLPPS